MSSKKIRSRVMASAAILPVALMFSTQVLGQSTKQNSVDPAMAPSTTQGVAADQAGPSGLTGPAAQQAEAEAEPNDQAIIVTGSRIARPTLDSPVPVTTISSADLTRTGQTNIGDVLERIPALSASTTQASSLAGGGTIGGTGLNFLDLRNLGDDRTLVLINGQRQVSSLEGYFRVDTNTIPTDLIDRVDVVTGGSSAVYGSDAMAGVVNFVLKQHFDGASFNAQGGISSRRDRGTYRISGLVGKNFSEGRGNIALDLEYERANSVGLTDRPSITGAYTGRNQFQLVNKPGSGLPERTYLTGIHSFGYSDGGTFIPYVGSSVLSCGAGGVAAACLPNGRPRVFLFQPDGSLTEANYGRDFRPIGSGNNQGGDGSVLNNTGVLVPGYKRYVADMVGHYDFSSAFRPYFDAKFVRVDSYQTSSPTFTQGGPQGPGQEYDGFGTYINTPIQLDNAFLTPQARALITSLLPNGSSFFNLNRNNVDTGSRGEIDRRDLYRIVVGAKGDISDDFNYDFAVNYGHLKTHYQFTNNRLENNWYQAIDAVQNAAGQIVCRVNQVSITDPACQPLDILGAFGAQQTAAQRQAALNYINTTSQYYGRASELDINGSIQGSTARFFNLPGGPIRFSIGGEYRRESAAYHYDDVVANGETFLNAIAPFNPPALKVKEGYAEVDIPLLKDKPFFQELSFNGAGRVADYNGAVGTVWAYNGGAIYAPIKDIRFRVNYSHSVRAPNLNDLYQSASQNYASVDDPCDPNFVDAGTSNRPKNCAAAGVPAGYEAPQTRAATLEILSGGNPNLKAETSRSWTYGVILQPRFIPGLAVTVDYYDIKIKNVISAVDAQTILNDCYDAATLNNPFCALIKPRNADGTFQLPALLQSTLNYAAERAKGIDVDVSYNHSFTPDDKMAFRFVGSWVRTRDDYPNIDDPSVPDRVKGELGTPIYQFNTSLDFTHKAFTLGYELRYIGRQSIAQWEEQHAVSDIPDTPFDPDYIDRIYYPHVIYHDVRFSLDVNKTFTFYGGVDNLTDKLPPFGLLGNGGAGLTAGETTNTDGLYDNIGRFMYMGIRVKL